MTNDTIRKATEKVATDCPHCSGSRYILDEVETTFGEFEAVSYLCHMCVGTGRAMAKEERKAYRESLRAGNPGRGRS